MITGTHFSNGKCHQHSPDEKYHRNSSLGKCMHIIIKNSNETHKIQYYITLRHRFEISVSFSDWLGPIMCWKENSCKIITVVCTFFKQKCCLHFLLTNACILSFNVMNGRMTHESWIFLTTITYVFFFTDVFAFN